MSDKNTKCTIWLLLPGSKDLNDAQKFVSATNVLHTSSEAGHRLSFTTAAGVDFATTLDYILYEES